MTNESTLRFHLEPCIRDTETLAMLFYQNNTLFVFSVLKFIRSDDQWQHTLRPHCLKKLCDLCPCEISEKSAPYRDLCWRRCGGRSACACSWRWGPRPPPQSLPSPRARPQTPHGAQPKQRRLFQTFHEKMWLCRSIMHIKIAQICIFWRTVGSTVYLHHN
jgi:hypothetical protein